MRGQGYRAMCIHGDKKQEERDWVLGEFKSGKTSILVATDVAARGLGRVQYTDRNVGVKEDLLFVYEKNRQERQEKILFVERQFCRIISDFSQHIILVFLFINEKENLILCLTDLSFKDT